MHPVPLYPMESGEHQHPLVTTSESLADIQEREKELQAASEKARVEWQKKAARKEWESVKSDLDVFRHSGEKVTEDPRRTPEYRKMVVDGLGLTKEQKPHLSQQDLDAI